MSCRRPTRMYTAFLTALADLGRRRRDLAGALVLNDDGGWCWYQDERAIVYQGQLLVGSIAMGRADASRRGSAELTIFDLDSRGHQRITLRAGLGADDHNVPALQVLPNGRVLAVYATHGRANAFWYRLQRSERSGAVGTGARNSYRRPDPALLTRTSFACVARATGSTTFIAVTTTASSRRMPSATTWRRPGRTVACSSMSPRSNGIGPT